MKVEVKLFATLRNHLKDNKSGVCMLEFAGTASVQEAIDLMELPEEIPRIVLVNGVQKGFDEALSDGDTLSIFPPVAGG